MKKKLKKLIVAGCMLPCVLAMTACDLFGGDSNNTNTDNTNSNTNTTPSTGLTEQQKDTAFGYLKTARKKEFESGKTLVIENSETLDTSFDLTQITNESLENYNCTRAEFVTELGSMLSDATTHYCNKDITEMAYKNNGEGYIEKKSLNNGILTLTEGQYVKAKGNKYIKYTDSNEYGLYANYVDNKYMQKESNFIINNELEVDSNSMIETCETFEDFKVSTKEYMIDNFSDVLPLETNDMTVTLELQYINNRYELVMNLKAQKTVSGNIFESSMGNLSDKNVAITNSSANINAVAKISFNSSSVLSEEYIIDMDASILGNYSKKTQSTFASESSQSEETSSIPVITNVSMNSTSSLVYKNSVDMSKLEKDFTLFVEEGQTINNNIIDIVINFDNENFPASIVNDMYDNEIDWNEVEGLIKTNVLQVKTNTINKDKLSLKIYLDKDMTIEANAQTMSKVPSHSINIYVKLEVEDGYAVIFEKVIVTSYGFVVGGNESISIVEVDGDELTFDASNMSNLKVYEYKINGKDADVTNFGKLTPESKGVYYVLINVGPLVNQI